MNIDQSFKAKYKIAKLEVHAIKKDSANGTVYK